MAQIHHFEYGALTPTVSYILSVLGSLLGLTSAVRLRSAFPAGTVADKAFESTALSLEAFGFARKRRNSRTPRTATARPITR